MSQCECQQTRQCSINVHPITELIWLYNEQASSQQRRREIARLAELLDDDVSMDAAGVVGLLTKDSVWLSRER